MKNILTVIFLFYCMHNCADVKPPLNKIVKANNLSLGGEQSKWPQILNENFYYPGSKIESFVALDEGEAGLIIQSTGDDSNTINNFYKTLFKNMSWKIVWLKSRPSEGLKMLVKNKSIAAQAGLDGNEKGLPGNNKIIIAEGELGVIKEEFIVTISIISLLNKSEIRLYFKKIPSAVKQYMLP